MISKTEFIKMLKCHDWHYRMSDNSSTYSKGENSERKIFLAIKNNPDLKQIFDDYRAGKII